MLNSLKLHFFWKFAFGEQKIFENLNVDLVHKKITTIVRFSYLFFLLLTVIRFNNIEDIQNAIIVKPLWPVFWVNKIGFKVALNWCMILMFLSFLFTSIYYKKIWLRISCFLLFFVYTALIHSFGKISHIYHLLIIVLFTFLFLDFKSKAKNIIIFASLQFFILFTYTVTGLWKLLGGSIQLFRGEVSIFSSNSMLNIIENQFAINNQDLPYFTEYIVAAPIISMFFLWVTILIETLSVFVFFKGNLQRFWGVLMIIIHAGIALIMDVNFYVAPFLLGVLFVFSPFVKEEELLENV